MAERYKITRLTHGHLGVPWCVVVPDEHRGDLVLGMFHKQDHAELFKATLEARERADGA